MVNADHLHPMIVHFPIALITVGFIADVVTVTFTGFMGGIMVYDFMMGQ